MNKKYMLALLLFVTVAGIAVLFLTDRKNSTTEEQRKAKLNTISVEKALMHMYSSEYKASGEAEKEKFNIVSTMTGYAILKNPADVASYILKGLLWVYGNSVPGAKYFFSILAESSADDWISNFVLGYYYFQNVEDEKALKHLKVAEKKYSRHSQNESSEKFLSFMDELKELLKKRINWEEPPRKKMKLEKPDNCYFIDIDPQKGYTASWDGECKDGMAHGKGVLSFSDGDTFNVTMKNGVMNGDAVIHWHNNMSFEGKLKDGLFHGAGALFENNTLIYKGMYKKGYKHGTGQIYSDSGKSIYKGFFKQGIPLNSGEMFCTENWSVKYRTPFSLVRFFPIKDNKWYNLVSSHCDERNRTEYINYGKQHMEEKYNKVQNINTENFEKMKNTFKMNYEKNRAPTEKTLLERNIIAVKTAWYIYNNMESLSREEIREYSRDLIIPE